MRFIEQFHQPNITESKHSVTIQNELLMLKNQSKSVVAKSIDKPVTFLNFKDIENPYIYNKEDRIVVRLMRTFRLIRNKIDSGELVIKIQDQSEIDYLLLQFRAKLVEKKEFGGVPVYFVESELDFEGAAISSHGEIADEIIRKLFNRNSQSVSIDYAKDNNFGGIIINSKNGKYNQEVLFHELGHVIDDVTRLNRNYEKNPNIKPIEKELCHNFITEFVQYATFGQESVLSFGVSDEFSQIIMEFFFYYNNGLKSPDIFGRYKKQCLIIAEKYGELYEIIDNDISGVIQNEVLSKVRKADSLDSINKIGDKFLEKYAYFKNAI